MLIDAFCHAVIQTLNQPLYISTEVLHALSIPGLEGRETEHKVKTDPQPVLQKMSFSVCTPTLIRNLRDSSTRDTLARPALWQMDTVLVDQAVEKFNLKTKQKPQ